MLVGMHTHARYVRGRAHGCAWVCVEAGNPDLQYLHGRSNPDYAHCSNPDYTMLLKLCSMFELFSYVVQFFRLVE